MQKNSLNDNKSHKLLRQFLENPYANGTVFSECHDLSQLFFGTVVDLHQLSHLAET